MSAQPTNTNGHAVNINAGTTLVRVNSVEPSTMTELKDFAKMAADSGFFGAATPQQALMIAMAGKDLGFSYTQSLRFFDVIKGKPSLKADGIVAACLARPEVCEYFDVIELTATKAVYETKRKGRPAVRYSYTIEEAQAAGLVNDMYKKHPKRMLSARCKAYLGRDVYPDILGGLLEQDEAREATGSHHEPPAAFVESRVVEPEPEPVVALTDAEVSFIKAEMDETKTEADLKKIGAKIANTTMSGEQSKDLRAHYAKRRNKIAKDLREAEEAKANDTSDAQEIEGEVVHAGND